jgi:hypothetical protein
MLSAIEDLVFDIGISNENQGFGTQTNFLNVNVLIRGEQMQYFF